MAWLEVQRLSASVSSNLAQVLKQIVELYLTFWALEKKGDLLVVSVSEFEINRLFYLSVSMYKQINIAGRFT